MGCQLPQTAQNFEEIIGAAVLCEKLGYDSVWAFDHLSPFWTRRSNSFECWTTLAAVAEKTRKIRIGSLVSNVNLRNPGLLAKMTSTLDNLSDGRLIVGLGIGDRMSRHELESYGFDFPEIDARVRRLRETIMILREMWTNELSDYEGTIFHIKRAANAPRPKQKPYPPIWVGGVHPATLRVVAEMADGWNYWNIDKRRVAKCETALSARCSELGRNPKQITISWAGTFSASVRNAGVDLSGSIMRQLEGQVSPETSYFIASFGPSTSAKAYEQFIEAVKKLTSQAS